VEYFLSKNIIQKAKLKKASNKDIFFLFKLLNDPKVIRNSLSKQNVNFKNHNHWFKKALQKKNVSIFIFKTAIHNLGHVRFDVNSKKQTFITYAVANEFRGANVGYKMLNLAIKKNSIKTNLYAIVKKNNEASKKIFKKLGFFLFKKDQKRGLVYYSKK
jgi:RimJ/RimL family protein N-acetyltransferase